MTPGVYVVGCEPATRQVGGRARRAAAADAAGRRGSASSGRSSPTPSTTRCSTCCARSARLLPYEASCGVGYEEVRADEARALEEIVARYRALAAQCDGVLVVGTDFAGVGTAGELAFNARVALNLGLPALLVVSGHERTPEEVRDGDLGRADDVAPLGSATSSAWWPTACAAFELDAVAARRRRAGLRAAGGRPADGADRRPGRRGVPRRGDRGRPRAARARGAAA